MDNYRQRDNAAYEREALRFLHSLGGECVGFILLVHLSRAQKANMWKVWWQASRRAVNKIASAEQEV